MLRMTYDNLRCENKTSPAIASFMSFTKHISTKIHLMTRCLERTWTENFFSNKRSDLKNVQNCFHTKFFHSVSTPSLVILDGY